MFPRPLLRKLRCSSLRRIPTDRIHGIVLARLSLPAIVKLSKTRTSKRQKLHSTPSRTFSVEKSNKNTLMDSLIARFGKDTLDAPDSYNRWRVVPYAVSTQLCLGSCFAWSVFNAPLTRELGGLSSASQDWLLSNVTGTFMVNIVALGLAMALCGKWLEKVGPKIGGMTGSAFYGGGMAVGAYGVLVHNLPLLYLGYGVIGGIGVGLCYLPPISTLVRWFPDRRGLATGMAICGFGGGAVIIAQLKKKLLEVFQKEPTYLGNKHDVLTQISEDGAMLAQVQGSWSEVINVSSQELATLGATHLEEGLYLVGTGNTGVAATMLTLGLGYFTICFSGALSVKWPHKDWTPPGSSSLEQKPKIPKKGDVNTLSRHDAVAIDDVMKIPQFWMQWITFLSTCTAGMGLMSIAKDVCATCFAASAISATTYVQALSVANLSGRFLWASSSDLLGRKNVFGIFCAAGAPLYFTLPYIVHSSSSMESYIPLILFYGSTMFIISFFGGGYSTMPAYETDLYGTKYVGAIHGRMMTASALSGLTGPIIFAKIRDNEELKAIKELVSQCDVSKFEERFGVGVEKLDVLIESNAVTISKLMEIAPPGTIDPTPYIYDPAFRTMGVVLTCGAIANYLVKPVDRKWFLREQEQSKGQT